MPHENPPIILQPREESFDFPSPAITAHWRAILRRRTDTVRAMRGDHLDAASLKPLVESVAAVRHITDETLRLVGEEHLVKERFDQGYFMRRSTLDAYGDRKTRAVCDCHDLGTLAALGFPNAAAPFSPEQTCRRRNIPLNRFHTDRAGRASSSRTRLITPDLTICWNRRWHV